LKPDKGFVCLNQDQTDGKCLDYKVRFLCPKHEERFPKTPEEIASRQSPRPIMANDASLEDAEPCTSSADCGDGICNMDFAPDGGLCEPCPGNTDQDCYDEGYDNNEGTFECLIFCAVEPTSEPTSEPIPEEINCYVNNGWCSHGCNDSSDAHVCECPTCWTLGDDGRTCSPEADKLTTTCTADSMIIRMNKCVMGDHDWTTATMATGCAFEEDPDNTDEVVLTNGLEECGMELSFTDSSIVYTNNMLIEASRFENLIVVRPDIEWEFQCAYQTEYTISGEQSVTIGTLAHGFAAANAKFAFGFDFFEDANFREVQADPTYQVGQQVNYGIKMNEGVKLTNLHFVATECSVTNGEDSFTVFDYSAPEDCNLVNH